MTRRNLVTAARILLATGVPPGPRFTSDLCTQVGVHPHSLQSYFPSESSLLDAVHDDLVNDCASRLRNGVDAFARVTRGDADVEAAATALAVAWPLDRASLLIRGTRRLRSLSKSDGGEHAAAAERRYVGALTEILSDLLASVGRQFAWSPVLAVRVILDTYERSFEIWVLEGNAEATFHQSPYIRRTLPTLLEHMSLTRLESSRITR